MIGDSLSSIPLPQVVDVKIEKNTKAEEPRAIEKSDQSDSSQLDMEKQHISKKNASKDIKEVKIELKTYDATDRSSREVSSNEAPSVEYEPINLVV